MVKQTGTFSAEGAFRLTGRGWVVTGAVTGQVAAGSQLVFDHGAVLHVVGVSLSTNPALATKFGLLVSESFAARQELVDRGLLDATARILE